MTPVNVPTPPKQGNEGFHRVVEVGPIEDYLVISVLAFGLIIMLLIVFVAYRCKYTASDTLRLVTVTLIVVATLFALSAGFDSEQIAPAMGLFGTIAGYLLGRTGRRKENIND